MDNFKITSLSFVTLSLASSLLGACVTEPATSGSDPGLEAQNATDHLDSVVVQPDGPTPVPRVRDLRIGCVADTLVVSVTSDLHVAFAYAELWRGWDADAVELSFHASLPLFNASNQFIGFSKTALFDQGKLTLTDASPVTCENVGEFGVMAIVTFEDGDTACTFGGDAGQVQHLRCPG